MEDLLPAATQAFLSRVARSAWVFRSAFAFFSTRFSLIDLPDFLDIVCRGDLSAMASSLIGSRERAPYPGRYAIQGVPRDRLEG